MNARPNISLKKRLASALLTIRIVEDGKLVPFIDHDTAKKLTASQIISLFHFDHYPIAKWLEGPDEPWNLVPRPIMEHRMKTAKIDTPASAKADRITERQAEFRRKMLEKAGISAWPQGARPLAGRKPKYDWKRGRYLRAPE